MKKEGKIAVFSGPSGSGKTTLISRLRKDYDVFFSVSATTRPPRKGEENGKDYLFLKEDEFLSLVRRGYFLEWAVYNGFYYGTPREPVEEALKKGKTVILDIDIQGAKRLREKRIQAVYIFVEPPSLEELERRLRSRGTESAEQVSGRIEIARKELDEAKKLGIYDYFITNNVLEEAVEKAVEILGLSK